MQSIATVKIKDAAELTPAQVKEMADWLRMHADDLEADHQDYAKGFTGNYMGR